MLRPFSRSMRAPRLPMDSVTNEAAQPRRSSNFRPSELRSSALRRTFPGEGVCGYPHLPSRSLRFSQVLSPSANSVNHTLIGGTGITFLTFALHPDWFLNPYPWYESMRRLSPVTRDSSTGLWSLFRYSDVEHTLRDYARFSSGSVNGDGGDNGDGWRPAPVASSMLSIDPPSHTRLRAMIAGPFSTRAVAELEPRIREITAGLFDPLASTGTMDVISDLAEPLPITVLADLMAVPVEDRRRFRVWCGALSGLPEALPDGGPADAAVEADVVRYFLRLIRLRRERPGADLVSTIVAAEVDGEQLTDREVLASCLLLLVMGNQATTHLIGNAVLCLLENPEATARLTSEPAGLRVALEEVLRFRSPMRSILRVATEAVSIEGETISKGDGVVSWIASANRDGDRFPEADRFIADRSPNPHLAFGTGVHQSIGAPLARLEGRIALEALLERCRLFRRRPSDEPLEPLASLVIQGVHHLPLVFEAS